METVLENIVHRKKVFLSARSAFTVDVLAELFAGAQKAGSPLKEKLSSFPGPNIIAEIKVASPSRGRILSPERVVDCAKIVEEYTQGGAAAVSVVTEEAYFLGSAELLHTVCKVSPLPVLRKDFILEESQIFESVLLGAQAVLLITRILSASRLERFIALCRLLGMTALVEVHDRQDLLKALDCGADVVGINNRDLATMRVSHRRTIDLLPLIPAGVKIVSESGIRSHDDIQELMEAGVPNFLVGEKLLESVSLTQALLNLRGASQQHTLRHQIC